jgi:hypothetical protein
VSEENVEKARQSEENVEKARQSEELTIEVTIDRRKLIELLEKELGIKRRKIEL